jgi:hypothetical protein
MPKCREVLFESEDDAAAFLGKDKPDYARIQNRAGIKKEDSIKEAIKKHNANVEKTIRRAEQGEIICLTDLWIDKETIEEKMIKEK